MKNAIRLMLDYLYWWKRYLTKNYICCQWEIIANKKYIGNKPTLIVKGIIKLYLEQ